ncbi:MAG: hypothetical protein M1838_002122 [Thelocarpon superellum]|nr:MAG: hypothetical protein M1838_002122 [Thelocarpon superellum]
MQPGPPHSFWLGHIPTMAKVAPRFPASIHPHVMMADLERKHNFGPLWFLDTWPISKDPQMIISDPTIARQVAQSRPLGKHPIVDQYVGHITGPTSILTSNGEEWRKVRALFNPAFALSHLMTLSGTIVDHTLTFCASLEEHAARGDIFLLEDLTTRLTIDVIGCVVLDADLQAQRAENPLVTAFRRSIYWTPKASEVNPLVNLNPMRPLVTWWYGRQMDRLLGQMLDERAAKRASGATVGRKTAIDLALDAQQGSAVDPAIRQQAIDQFKTFVFAGHDTTSSTISYVFYLLSLHPDCLARTRAEHDQVFGSDLVQSAERIRATPHLLNQLPYTLAVIKETLRMFPVADGIRGGEKGYDVTLDGKRYSTAGFMIMINHYALMHREDLFPQPFEFHPDRFLAPRPATSPQIFDIPKDAWRPFEKGPRACIGQELALLEMKIIMVLTLRRFDVTAAYDDWDRQHGGPGPVVDGFRSYQILVSSAKPCEEMPARVRKRH